MLVREHRFRTSSLELTCMGTSLSEQKISFRSVRTQYSRRVIKAYCCLRPYLLCPLFLSTGNYTVLTVTFPFKRRMGYYIIQVYIPCIFLVMLSWIVFWMRPDDSASRLTVGITTILTIVFLLGYTNGMLPKVCLPTTTTVLNNSVSR